MTSAGAGEGKRQGPSSATDGTGAAPSASSTLSLPRTALAETLIALPPAPTFSSAALGALVRLAEFGLIAISGAAIYLVYVHPIIGFAPSYVWAVPSLALLAIAVFQFAGGYRLPSLIRVSPQILRLAAGWTLVFLLVFAAMFFMKLEGVFSRVFFASWYVVGLGLILVWRTALSFAVRAMMRHGRLDRRVAIVGGGEIADRLIDALTAHPRTDLRICGVFDDRADDRAPDLVNGYPKLGTVDDLIAFARSTRVDLVIFALPVTAEARILAMLRKLWVLPVDIRLAAHMQKLRFRPRNYSYIAGTPMLDVADRPIAEWDLIAKWLFDKLVGSLLLLLALPVMVLAAIAVRLDSRGPVVFRQKRYGFNNELIEIFKFRSMHADQADPSASRLVRRGDPRVTRVGRFLRKTSIDELPQLLNVVFKGDLSLVGPRPHAIHAKAAERLYGEVVESYFARHKVKPGITGWAQVNGWRGETDTPEKIQKRVEHDLHYIENWSILFDLWIVLLTPFALLRTENAF